MEKHIAIKPNDPPFLKLEYTAPPWPVHARSTDVAKYEEVYTKGWDVLSRERHAKIVEE